MTKDVKCIDDEDASVVVNQAAAGHGGRQIKRIHAETGQNHPKEQREQTQDQEQSSQDDLVQIVPIYASKRETAGRGAQTVHA